MPSSQFQPGGDDGINNKNRKTFGAPFGKSPSVIGPQNRPGPAIASQDPDVEVFSEVRISSGQRWEKVSESTQIALKNTQKALRKHSESCQRALRE